MKKTLFFLSLLLVSTFSAIAQCDPNAHDWGTATFGVSPDPTVGETFDIATEGSPYAEIVFVLCPTTVTDVIPDFAGGDLAIDSIRLDSLTLFNGISDVALSTIGLNLTCNNNGDSEDPCMFMPGNPYCGDIIGVPTVSGVFDVKIFVTVFFNIFGPQQLPYSFEGYSLEVLSNIEEETMATGATLGQNAPNPANSFSNIQFDLTRADDVTFQLNNLVGEVVFMKSLKGRKGDNNFRLETGQLESGIYLYSIQTGDKKFTRKMIVQH